MANGGWAIETVALRKEYGPKVAVSGLDLTVARGEVFGFLGPNGAGKTTLVKMLLGLVRPTSGRGMLLGEPIGRPESRRHIGFLPEHFRFHEWLRADEFLELHGRLLHLPSHERQRRIPALLERVGLQEAAARPLGAYSKGMLQRIGLAQALLGHPALVFLDEPTSGLDPVGRRMVRDVIRDLQAEGVTVFLNSHLLSEVELTCQRVAIISAGRVVHTTALEEQLDGATAVDLTVGALDEGLVEGLRRWSPRLEVDPERRLITLYIGDHAVLPEISRWIVGRGAALYGLAPRRQTLEDLYVQLIHEGEE